MSEETPNESSAEEVSAAEEATEVAEELVEHDIETLLKERNEFKDIALRLQADFENYKKRVATQQQDEVDRATGPGARRVGDLAAEQPRRQDGPAGRGRQRPADARARRSRRAVRRGGTSGRAGGLRSHSRTT